MSLLSGVYAGSYYGGGYSGGSYGNKISTKTSINKVATDIAANYDIKFDAMQNYFNSGDSNKAMSLYNDLYDDVQATAGEYGYTFDDAQISQILSRAYQQATSESITTAIDKTNDSFMTGFKQGIPLFGLFNNGVSRSESYAKVLEQDLTASDYAKEGAGAAFGGIVGSSAVSAAAIGMGKLAVVETAKGTVGQVAKSGIKKVLGNGKCAKAFYKIGKLAASAVMKHPVACAVGAAAVGILTVIGKNTNWFGLAGDKE